VPESGAPSCRRASVLQRYLHVLITIPISPSLRPPPSMLRCRQWRARAKSLRRCDVAAAERHRPDPAAGLRRSAAVAHVSISRSPRLRNTCRRGFTQSRARNHADLSRAGLQLKTRLSRRSAIEHILRRHYHLFDLDGRRLPASHSLHRPPCGQASRGSSAGGQRRNQEPLAPSPFAELGGRSESRPLALQRSRSLRRASDLKQRVLSILPQGASRGFALRRLRRRSHVGYKGKNQCSKPLRSSDSPLPSSSCPAQLSPSRAILLLMAPSAGASDPYAVAHAPRPRLEP
jgi:hypothetical protein